MALKPPSRAVSRKQHLGFEPFQIFHRNIQFSVFGIGKVVPANNTVQGCSIAKSYGIVACVDDTCMAAAGENRETFVCTVETYVSRSN